MAEDNRTFPGYLNTAMGLLGFGGLFMMVGAVSTLTTKGATRSTLQTVGFALAFFIEAGGVVSAGGMNARRAWGWVVGIVVSALFTASAALALLGSAASLGEILALLAGVFLLVVLLLPASRALVRPAPPRPDEPDAPPRVPAS